MFASSPSFGEHIIIRHSKRARRLALRLDTQKRTFSLVIPRGMSLGRARRFVEDHRDWMRGSLDKLPAPVAFSDGAVIPVFGEPVTVRISFDPGLKRTNIILKNNELVVFTNLENPGNRIQRLLKTAAREKLTELAREKAAQAGRPVKSVQVRDTRSRWGSCSHDGALSFSWRLIFAPRETMDYIVAHEVAHLVHLNHGKAFWALCRELSENFTEGRRWIRDNGHELMRYG